MPRKILRSVCPYDCPDSCGLLVEVEDGCVLSVQGDPEHPHCRGRLCAKMNRYERTVHSPQRLTMPLLRTGKKGEGSFRPIGWDEAVALIASRWREIIAEHGAQSILPYSYAGTMGLVQRNAGHAFFHRLGASRLLRTICAPAKEAAWSALMGKTPALHPDAVLDSKLVILWGINAAATNIQYLHRVKQAKRRGAKVWLIDTYAHATAALADELFLVRPGSDGALALGLMHLLVREGLVDEAFIAARVQGFEELKERVLPDYPPDAVSALTGLPVSRIEAMARDYGRTKRAMIRVGGGISRHGNGAMTVRAIAALPALTGAWAHPGGGCFLGTSTGGAFAMETITREDLMGEPTRIVNMNRLGEALAADAREPVKSLYVYHSNPASVAPDQNAVLSGLLREDLFCVVHERFLTDTAQYADLVLPATSSLEHGDLYRAYGSYCIQRAAAAIPPVGQSKSNLEVFGLLAAELGFTEEHFRLGADELIERLLAVPNPLREGIDVEALARGRAVELRCPPPGPPFGTPSGRIEILNPRHPQPLPRYLPPHGGELPFAFMTAPSPWSLNASFYERPDLRQMQGGMELKMNPADAAGRGLAEGELVAAFNERGEVAYRLRLSEAVPEGLLVAEGLWWMSQSEGGRGTNALTSQRLTDEGQGSTFCDCRVDLRRAGGAL